MEPPEPTLDDLAERLQHLRGEAGDPSYAEIALRIARQRQARGVPAAEARPGRTTVYDAFRTGRRRIDTDLVVEIVRALGADAEQSAQWAVDCRGAQGRQVRTARDRTPAPVEPSRPGPWSPTRRVLALVLLGSLLVNLAGRGLVGLLGLSIHLDMAGTAFVSVVLGPWWGALVGVATNLAGALLSGWQSVPFAVVNVTGALLWGYGVHRFGLGRTIPRFFGLCVAVAVACSVVAAPIIELLDQLHQHADHGQDRIASSFRALGWAAMLAVVAGNLLSSLADKIISGFASLAAAEALPRRVREGLGHLGPPRA